MTPEVRAERWFLLAWILVSLWILACALLVKGEYGDGYQTIVNARYFFADLPNYYVQRGPLAALALAPVEMLRSWVGWGPIDVRPYHVYSGLLHCLYLLGCWILLKRCGGNRIAQILAFVAAVLSPVFYANAPHLSHDIIPGLLFLLLILICNRWLNAPSGVLALQLVLLGTAVTFIKQTYAIFWVALVIYAFGAYLLHWDKQRVTGRKAVALLGLAVISGAISWIGYGFFIAPELPSPSVLRAPLDLMLAVSQLYGEEYAKIFTSDLYLRNIHNFGIAAMLLALPGLVLAFRGGDARLRMVAVCWIISVIALQLVSFREVRYLAFLAPLTAVLIVPVIQLLIRHRGATAVLILVMLFDQYRGLTVSAAQLTSTAGLDIDRFIAAPSGTGKTVFSRVLSFVYMAASPMRRDPYHGIYHMTAVLYRRLNEFQLEVVELPDPRDIATIGIEPGDQVFYSNGIVLREMPWTDNNVPASVDGLITIAGDAVTVRLQRQDDDYFIEGADDRLFMLIPNAEVGQEMPLMSPSAFPSDDLQRIYGGESLPDELTMLGVAIKALCQADICLYE